jgi:hypothetical protein
MHATRVAGRATYSTHQPPCIKQHHLQSSLLSSLLAWQAPNAHALAHTHTDTPGYRQAGESAGNTPASWALTDAAAARSDLPPLPPLPPSVVRSSLCCPALRLLHLAHVRVNRCTCVREHNQDERKGCSRLLGSIQLAPHPDDPGWDLCGLHLPPATNRHAGHSHTA